jgi:hypothetical protein
MLGRPCGSRREVTGENACRSFGHGETGFAVYQGVGTTARHLSLAVDNLSKHEKGFVSL